MDAFWLLAVAAGTLVVAWEINSDLCKIWDFHDGDYEESSLLGCGAV
jgi:hypothetical protein